MAGIADERSTSTDRERLEARQVAEAVVKSFMAAYDTRDSKAISALFLPDAMLLGFNGTCRGVVRRSKASTPPR
jgi:ketosteroid isomerase-like protein